MRIVLLTPGTGNFLCGSCLRDNALARELTALGHDAMIAPLYLPFALEDQDAEVAERVVRMGGINVYLQQKLPALRFLPRFLHDWLDSPRLLRWAASRSNMTGASGLGALTLSVLRGEEGRQRAEVEQLASWLATLPRPDVVVLSNALLIGMARELGARLGCPVLCTLQGEAPFLDSLPEPHRAACWSLLAERAGDVAAFLPVSRYTADLMGERLGLDPSRVHTVWNGIDPTDFDAPAPERGDRPPTVGYLARMCRDKGLATLFDAFLLVKERIPATRLDAAGVVLGEDRELVASLERRARELGIAADASFRADVSRAQKIELLRGCDVFSVPATYGESFGLYLLEALASGVPVVAPRHGGSPEIVTDTGGGLLCEPDDPASLANALCELLLDRPRARALGEAGRAAVRERFTAVRMARDVERVCRMAADPSRA